MRLAVKEKNKGKRIERLNLIPILDAIFIFIFFLLLSAEFVQLGEIAMKVDPLAKSARGGGGQKESSVNLFLKKKLLVLETDHEALKEKIVLKIDHEKNYLKELHKKLVELKKKMPDERKIKIWPSDNVSYESVLKVVEVVKYSYKKDKKKRFPLFDLVTLGHLKGGL